MFKKNKSVFLLLFILLLLFVSHSVFLRADPDMSLDPGTRGALTDEGLYASQIKNFVHTGTFEAKENTTFVRGPLFNIIQYPFFAIFGTSLLVARLVSLCFCLLILFFVAKNKNMLSFWMMAIILTMTQPHIFGFTHYALSEMMAVIMMLAALHFFLKALENCSKRNIFFASFCVFISYSLKIQFLYLAAVLPALMFVILIFYKDPDRKTRLKLFVTASLFSVVLFAFYLVCWYLPNRDFYDFVMSSETAQRFPIGVKSMWEKTVMNFDTALWKKPLSFLWIIAVISIPAGIIMIVKQKFKTKRTIVFLFSLLWFLSELHKIPMNYLPNRYLLSTMFSAILLGISVLWLAIEYKSKWTYLLFIPFVFLLFMNLKYIYKSWSSRTYEIRNVNNYLSQTDFKNAYVLGAWAPSLTWNTSAHAIPVWGGYMNDKNPLQTFHPRVIITESDEKDNDQCYSKQNIQLTNFADSVKSFVVGSYVLDIYWISPKAN